MSSAGRLRVGLVVAAGVAVFGAYAMADNPLAPGQRVSVNFAGGKEGAVVRIGTADDGSYQGCTRIHFDYEGPDPSTGQWFCPSGPFKITPLGGPAGPPGAAQPAFQPAPGGNQSLGVGACVAVRGAAGRILRLTPGGYVIQTQGQAPGDAMNWARSDVTAGPCPAALAVAPPAGAVSCPVADANLGASPQGASFLAIIRSVMDHPAAPGMDGAVSVTFQSFQVATTAKTGTLNLGAWRSEINVHATIPPQSLGLVAGTYSDTIVVTLAAL